MDRLSAAGGRLMVAQSEVLGRLDVMRDAVVEAGQAIINVAKAWTAPHWLHGAKLTWTGTEWRAAIGEGPSLIAGYGGCPEHAALDFDAIWRGQYPPRPEAA
jgi:hypothetical protein